MKQVLWIIRWVLKAAIFFTLFAFALNNQQDVTVNFFFGRQWQAPLVLVVLCTLAAGVVIGVLGMVPRWWKHRRAALKVAPEFASSVLPLDEPTPRKAASRTPTSHGDAPHGV